MAKLKTIFEFHDRISRKLLRPTKAVTKMTEATQRADRAAQRLAKAKVAPKLTVRDKASRILDNIRRKTERLDGKTSSPTVRVNDKASAAIDGINGKLDRMKGVVLGIAAAAGVSAGGLLFAGQSAIEMDARAAAVTNMEPSYITPAVQSIYYGEHAGTSREAVLESLLKIGQQTNLQGNDLTAAALTTSKLNSLRPDANPQEITRAQSAFYNAMGAEFGRTADSLAYIYRNAGDQYEDIFDTFNEYATTFSKLQINPEQLASGLVAGQQAGGFNYDVLADSVREWGIKSINEMNTDVISAYEKMFGRGATESIFRDLKSGDMSGQQFLAKISSQLSKEKDISQIAAMGSLLFGTQFEDNHKAILAFVKGLSTAADTTGELNRQFDQLRASPLTPVTDSIRNMRGILEDTGKSVLTGVAPAFESLNKWMATTEGQAAIANFSKSISDLAISFGNNLAKGIQWTIENWDTLLPIIKTATVLFVGLFAVAKGAKLYKTFKALMPLFRSFGKLGKGIGWLFRGSKGSGGGLLGFIKKLLPWAKVLGRWLLKLGGVFVKLIRWIRPFAPWIARIIGVGLRFIPVIGWIITAVLAAYWAWKNWDKIKAFLAPLFDWLSKEFRDMIDWFVNAGQWIADFYNNWLTLDGLKKQLSPFFDWVMDKIGGLTDMFSNVGDKIKAFKDGFNDIKSGNFSIGMPKWLGGDGFIQLGADGSHARGISNIPFDGYRAILHKGETVLPASEASLLRQMAASRGRSGSRGNVNVTFTGDQHFHNGSDEDGLVRKVVAAIETMLDEEEDTGYKGEYAF